MLPTTCEDYISQFYNNYAMKLRIDYVAFYIKRLRGEATGRVERGKSSVKVIPVVTFLTPLAESFSDLKDR